MIRPVELASIAVAIAAVVLTPLPSLHAADVVQPALGTNRYEFRPLHDPNGIGKFYFGREIAHVMGHQAAEWLERTNRDEEEHTGKLVDNLNLKAGDVVADIGCGTGYFSRRIARKIVPDGRVLGVDIQPEMLELLNNNMAKAGVTNVVPVLGTIQDPRLAANSVDLALMVDVYHEFDYPFEMVQSITRALKPGGRLVFVEFRAEDPRVPIKTVHKMSESQVKREMSLFPLDWVETIGVLPRQHIIVFRKRAK